MAAIIDTGFLYAITDHDDRHHLRATEFLVGSVELLLLPSAVLVESAYLVEARLGHRHMRRFVERIGAGPLRFEPILKTDLPRVHELLEQYADAELDFVDAVIVTLAERQGVRRILTVDHRDFGIIRPRHCDYFELLP
jgi:predicted nucleic acid-binding protein